MIKGETTMTKKLSKEEKTSYRRGFILCMSEISSYCIEEVANRIRMYEVYCPAIASGYRDGYRNWQGEVGEFENEDLAYSLRKRYEGYWGQSDFNHPEA